MKASSVARAYSSADLSSKTDGRKPEELLILLLDKACSCLRRAAMLPMDTLEDASWEKRLQITQDFHNNCSRAMQIVVALRELLDLEAGGELAAQLQETYTAIATTIWDASRAKNVGDLSKMLEALIELRSAWETVASG
jgi:flagellin-specific chaperone FliS